MLGIAGKSQKLVTEGRNMKDPVLEVLNGLLLARCVLEDAYDVADWKYKKDLLYLMRDIDNLSETVKEMEGGK